MKILSKWPASFFSWWKDSLLSCLPQGVAKGLTNLSNKFDLIIAQHGETVFIQNAQGKIINSISSGVDEEVPDDSIVNITELNTKSEDTPTDGETIVFINKTTGKHHSQQETDITVTEYDEFEDIDKTAQIYEFISRQSNESTDFNVAQPDTGYAENENTRVFINDGGRMRSVNPHSLDNEDRQEEIIDQKSGQSGYQNIYERVAFLLGKYQRNNKCLFLIPDEKVFFLSLSYPIEASENIDNVLRHNLEKHVPLNFDEIHYFYTLNTNADDKKIEVDVAIIKTSELNLIDDALRPYLKKGLVCSSQSLFQKFGSRINIKKPDKDTYGSSFFRYSSLLKAVNVVLLLALMALPYQFYLKQKSSLPDYSDTDIKRVKSIVASLKGIDRENKYRQDLIAQLNREPRVIDLLSTLSDIIAPQAWLSSFSFKGDEIRIKGEAVSAAIVSDNLNKAGLFDSIKFVSSIIKNTTNDRETFELLLRVKSNV